MLTILNSLYHFCVHGASTIGEKCTEPSPTRRGRFRAQTAQSLLPDKRGLSFPGIPHHVQIRSVLARVAPNTARPQILVL